MDETDTWYPLSVKSRASITHPKTGALEDSAGDNNCQCSTNQPFRLMGHSKVAESILQDPFIALCEIVPA